MDASGSRDLAQPCPPVGPGRPTWGSPHPPPPSGQECPRQARPPAAPGLSAGRVELQAHQSGGSGWEAEPLAAQPRMPVLAEDTTAGPNVSSAPWTRQVTGWRAASLARWALRAPLSASPRAQYQSGGKVSDWIQTSIKIDAAHCLLLGPVPHVVKKGHREGRAPRSAGTGAAQVGTPSSIGQRRHLPAHTSHVEQLPHLPAQLPASARPPARAWQEADAVAGTSARGLGFLTRARVPSGTAPTGRCPLLF